MTTSQRSPLGEVFDRHLGMSEADAVDWLEDALGGSASPWSSPLSSSELDYLTEHGGPGVKESLVNWSPEDAAQDQVRLAIESLAQIVEGSVTIAQAATRLGVSKSRISHRLTGKTLWAVRIGSTRYIPAWQFATIGTLLPGLTDVVRAIPDGASPVSVGHLMNQQQEELSFATPIDHLMHHRDPAPICDLLADLDRW